MSLHFTTVASGNYVAGAIVALRSAMETHPGSTSSICFYTIDPLELEILRAHNIDIQFDSVATVLSSSRLAKLETRYSDIELFSALKFFNLVFCRKRADVVVHTDTDTLFLNPVFDWDVEPSSHAIEVFPHVHSPLAREGVGMSDLDLVQSGIINGGLIAVYWVHAAAQPILEWLTYHVEHHCFVSKRHNLYADQTWLSLLPHLFRKETRVSDDLSVNVAYWNLIERSISRPDPEGAFIVNGQHVLKMFHFSGYQYPSQQLSIHIREMSTADQIGAIKELVTRYRQLLDEVHNTIPDFFARPSRYRRFGLRRRVVRRRALSSL
jgi:hypothetical protein